MADPAYTRKVLGIMQLSTLRPLSFEQVKDFIQIRHNDRLLGDFHKRIFDELSALEILERMGVEAREDALKLGQY